jgi:hypothetical protein
MNPIQRIESKSIPGADPVLVIAGIQYKELKALLSLTGLNLISPRNPIQRIESNHICTKRHGCGYMIESNTKN